MSTSEYDVHLTTDNPQADVLLIDSRFRLVARGPSPLRARVPVGLYSMKVKIGDEERETLFAVRPDSDPELVVNLEPPAFSSPVPLVKTDTIRDHHRDAARKYLSVDAPRISRGQGSSLMVCVRNASTIDIGDVPESYAKQFRGFRLLDAQGAVLVDLDAEAEHNVEDRFMAARVDVPVGSYALAYDSDGQRLCIPLATAAGWILQAYLQIVPSAPGRTDMRPDFRDISLIFDRVDAGFSEHRFDFGIMETVRKGLIEGRNYVGTAVMRDLLTVKFENPMLGLYGAHLLLLQPEVDFEELSIVIRNTARILGDSYPDVVALAWAYRRRAGRALPPPLDDPAALLQRLTGPPLLARSWDPLLEAALETAPSLITTSPAFGMAANLVSQGVYLTWRRSVPPTAATSPPAPSDVVVSAPTAGASTPMPFGGLLSALGTLAFEFFKALRGKITGSAAGPLPVASIGAIATAEEAAAVLRWIARSYEWANILPSIKRDPDWMGQLSGLQRDLFLTMRIVSTDKHAIEQITARYVDQLLQTHHVPLATLVQALSGLELGGYWSSALQRFLKPNKT